MLFITFGIVNIACASSSIILFVSLMSLVTSRDTSNEDEESISYRLALGFLAKIKSIREKYAYMMMHRQRFPDLTLELW